MKQIKSVTIIGMGALGVLYGSFFAEKLGVEQITFLADRERVCRGQGRTVTSNGRPWQFRMRDGALPPEGEPDGLLLFAVKGTALEEAIALARPYVGEDTAVLSLLNGISSETVIGRALGEKHVISCVAQGMDAVKLGNALTYTQLGRLCIGITPQEESKRPLLQSVTRFFDETGLPYTVEEDITKRLWSKWMLNVGVNQTVMVAEGTYGTIQKPGKARDMMTAAMREVVLLAQRTGIHVTEKDLEEYVELMNTMSPEGMPSMRQDGLMKRPSEVELFAGEVLRRAEKLGVEVPVNRELYRRVKEIEETY